MRKSIVARGIETAQKAIKNIFGEALVAIPQGNTHVKVYRVPKPGKRAYSQLVTVEKADRLINGVIKINTKTGEKVIVPLKRKFVLA